MILGPVIGFGIGAAAYLAAKWSGGHAQALTNAPKPPPLPDKAPVPAPGPSPARKEEKQEVAPTPPTPPSPSPLEDGKRIVDEAKDIVDGKREAFSDNAPPSPPSPVLPPPVDVAPPAPVPGPSPAPVSPPSPVLPPPVDVAPPAPVPGPSPAPVVPPEPLPGPIAPIPGPAAPPPGYDPAQARKLATAVAKNIDGSNFNYSRPKVKEFQTAAGIPADGIYGPETRSALEFYGVRRPPKPLFKGADGTYGAVPYRWR